MPNISLSGGAMVFLGAFFWSLCSPIVKFLNMDPFLILGLRSLIAGLTLLPFLRPRQLRRNSWLLMYLFSYAGLTMSVIVGLGLTTAPIVIGMQYTSLIILFLANFLLTGRFDKKAFLPVCIIMLGVVLFMCSDTDGANLRGNLVALGSGVFFAGMTASARKASGGNALGLTAVASLFTFLLVMLVFPHRVAGALEMSGFQWWLILLQGVVQVGGGYAFYNLGLEKVTPQKAAVIALWEMVMGPLWVALLVHEYPSVLELIGLAVIMAGIFLDARLDSRDNVSVSS